MLVGVLKNKNNKNKMGICAHSVAVDGKSKKNERT